MTCSILNVTGLHLRELTKWFRSRVRDRVVCLYCLVPMKNYLNLKWVKFDPITTRGLMNIELGNIGHRKANKGV